jgi:hypothetical protein
MSAILPPIKVSLSLVFKFTVSQRNNEWGVYGIKVLTCIPQKLGKKSFLTRYRV